MNEFSINAFQCVVILLFNSTDNQVNRKRYDKRINDFLLTDINRNR